MEISRTYRRTWTDGRTVRPYGTKNVTNKTQTNKTQKNLGVILSEGIDASDFIEIYQISIEISIRFICLEFIKRDRWHNLMEFQCTHGSSVRTGTKKNINKKHRNTETLGY
jgi:hypothetical protein